MSRKPSIIGFFQALGLTIYVGIFAIIVQITSTADWNIKLSPPVSIMFALLVFVFSALVSASLILGYPLVLFFTGHRSRAIYTVAWSGVWMVICGAIILVSTIIFNN